MREKPMTFTSRTEKLLRATLKDAPLSGDLTQANNRLGARYYCRRKGGTQRLEMTLVQHLLTSEGLWNQLEHDITIDFPPAETMEKVWMARTIIVCAVLDGKIETLAMFWRMINAIRAHGKPAPEPKAEPKVPPCAWPLRPSAPSPKCRRAAATSGMPSPPRTKP